MSRYYSSAPLTYSHSQMVSAESSSAMKMENMVAYPKDKAMKKVPLIIISDLHMESGYGPEKYKGGESAFVCV